jgi:hypothetical protein
MTCSILLRDPATGTLGAAVATQGLINAMYVVHAMQRLRAGEAPDPGVV